MLKVMTVVGTRPELIRLSRVILKLDLTVNHILVHTGQNYDYDLNQVFFEDLGIRKPDYSLGIDTSSLGRVLGEILIRTEEVLVAERPDALLILGDTNSSIAALIAKRMHIPVYHMEAGNRCFDENVPEETNRRLVDHVADFNLVYTEHARRNLLAEGLHPRRIMLTGSPMREVLEAYRSQIDASDILDRLGLVEHGYFLVSAHREENVDSPARLRKLLSCLEAVYETFGIPLLVSTHPRTRKRLDAANLAVTSGLVFHTPFGFHDYNRLQMSAACVLSDSGTIAEEAAILRFSALTLRDSIERPEALDSGGIIMTGLEPDDVVAAARVSLDTSPANRLHQASLPQEYEIADTSERTVRFIMSTARRSNQWHGIRD